MTRVFKLLSAFSVLISLFYNSNTLAQVNQFPQVYYNGQGTGACCKLLIHQANSYDNGSFVDQLEQGSKIGAASLSTNSQETWMNWIKVCLPSTSSTSNSPSYGYMPCDEFYARIDESNSYATVNTTSTPLGVRTCAGCTSSFVTINGQSAWYGKNSILALTGNVLSGYYEIYLTDKCSQMKGWVNGIYLTFPSNQSYKNVGGRICTDASACNFSGSINGATITFGNLGNTYSSGGFYQYKLPTNSNGNITCTHPSYNTSTPSSYPNYSANAHRYDRNFIMSNSASCSEPTMQARNIIFSNVQTDRMTISWSNGNGSGRLVKMNSSTSISSPSDGNDYTADALYDGSGSQYVYNGTGNSVTVSGLTPNTEYWFRVYEANCMGNDPDYLTSSATDNPNSHFTSNSCTAPNVTASSNSPVSNGATISLTATTISGASYNWTGPNGYISSQQNPSISNATASVAGSYCVVATVATCSSPQSCTAVTVGASSSIIINNSASEIPPWQREGDEFGGYISATTIPTATAWHLKVYINSSLVKTYNSTTGTITNFSSNDFGTFSEGDIVTYKAELVSSGVGTQSNFSTNIIRKKLNQETIVYFKDGTNNDKLLIPVKYFQGISTNNLKVKIERVKPHTSLILDIGFNVPIKIPASIKNNSSINEFGVNAYGYCEIDINSSDIESSSMLPGEFEYKIYNSGNLISDETGTFSLVKIGMSNADWNNPSSDKILLMLGGWTNEVEGSFDDLSNNSDNSNSDDGYSVLAYVAENSGNTFNVWYIAQGNSNSVCRNAYDIGAALERIKTIVNPSEINIISHSKGGLDARATLSNLKCSMSNNSPQSYPHGNTNNLVKRVVFLGSPHYGVVWGSFAYLGIDPFWPNIANSPGTKDLLWFSNILSLLNNSSQIQNGTKFLNLTGYTGNSHNIPFTNYTYSVSGLSDGVVSTISSENPYVGLNPLVQLYQKGTHLNLHRNNTLSSAYHNDCALQSSNLEKILQFLTQNSPAVQSCAGPADADLDIFSVGSIASGASLSIKSINDTTFTSIGTTDENGSLHLYSYNHGDSIKIETPGYDVMTFALDSMMISRGKVFVPLFKTAVPTSKIQYPSLSLLNDNSVTNTNNINLKVSATNAITYEISSPFNQDSAFIPLILNGEVASIMLDTGINQVFVKISNANDTVLLSKLFYYLPDTLFDLYSTDLTINGDFSIDGANLYLNGAFEKKMRLPNTVIRRLQEPTVLRFSKLGYQDTIIELDTVSNIYVTLQPLSYSSMSDSSVFILSNNEPDWWKNISVRSVGSQTVSISVKQFDESFTPLGLKVKSRNFLFRNLNYPISSQTQVAIALDQVENLSKDSIYLFIQNDTHFIKIPVDSSMGAFFDWKTQKVQYNNLNFSNGASHTQALVLLKKQHPIRINNPSYNINTNDTLSIPIAEIFTDPDSIKNDMFFQLANVPSHISVNIANDKIVVIPSHCWSGNISFTLNAQHDWLSKAATINVTVNPSLFPTISANGSTNLCPGQSVDLTGSSGIAFLWSDSSITQSITVTTAGNYSLTVTDNLGCTTSSSITINALPFNAPLITGNLTVCPGKLTTLDAGSGYTNYQWSNNTVIQSTTVGAGSFSVTVSDFNGCTGSDSKTVVQHFVNQPSISGDNAICGGTTNLGAGNGYLSYAWSNNDSSETINVGAGTYSVTVTDFNNCTSTASYTVTILPSVTVNITPTIAKLCSGDSVTLRAVGAVTYTWSTLETADTIIVNTPGLYSVTATDGNGCSGSSSKLVTEFANPTVSITGNLIVCGNNTTVLTVDSGYAVYEWSNNSGLTQINVGTGNYSVTVTDIHGCTAADIHTVSQSNLSANLSKRDVNCYGENDGSVYSNVSGGSTPYSYIWNTGDTSSDLNNLYSGIYEVTVTDNNSCTTSANVFILQPQQLTISSITNDDDCAPGDNGSISLIVSGGVTPYTFGWSNGSLIQNIDSLSAGSYSVTVMDSNNCIVTETDSVYSISNLNISITSPDSGFCYGESLVLFASGATSYQWSNGQNGDSLITSIPGTFTVIGTDGNTCTGTASANVIEYPRVVATASANPQSILIGDSVVISATGGLFYEWSSGQNTASFVDSPTISSSYIVTVTDVNNCTAVSSISVSVLNDTNCVNSEILLSSTFEKFPASGGEGNFMVTPNNATCQWSVVNALDIPWVLNVSPTTAQISTGQVNYAVVRNLGNSARKDSLRINTGIDDQYFVIYQACGLPIPEIQVENSCHLQVKNPITTGIYRWFYNGYDIPNSNLTWFAADTAGVYQVGVTSQDGQCLSDLSEAIFVNCMPNGTMELDSKYKLEVYPNPNNGKFRIELRTNEPSEVEIKIINILGEDIFIRNERVEYEYLKTIDLSQHAKGIYLILIAIDNKVLKRNVIIK